MKRLAGIFMIGLFIAMAPLHISNAYLRSAQFELITVGQQDSVWSIAAHYTVDDTQAANLREAIIAINDLDDAASIRYGQKLKIPVLQSDSVRQRLAEK